MKSFFQKKLSHCRDVRVYAESNSEETWELRHRLVEDD